MRPKKMMVGLGMAIRCGHFAPLRPDRHATNGEGTSPH
jgi:hypothetical protein